MKTNIKFIAILIFVSTMFETVSETNHVTIFRKRDGRQFGGWTICFNLLELVHSILPRGATILELGTHWNTQELAKYYTVYAIEHSERWIGAFNINYIYAPIRSQWYETKNFEEDLPKSYDLILIDGPPIDEGTQADRYGFYRNKKYFNLNVPIIINDVDRDSELKLLEDLADNLNRTYEIYSWCKKSFGYIPLTPTQTPDAGLDQQLENVVNSLVDQTQTIITQ